MIRLCRPGFYCYLLLVLLTGSAQGSPSVDNQLVAVVVRETTGPSPDELRSHHVASDDVTVRPTVHVVPGDWDIKGAWTLLPLFPRLLELHPNATWFVLLGESTRVDWVKLVGLTRNFDAAKEWFIGHELWDREPTIVHHFAFHQDPTSFKYPFMDGGILLSQPVVKRIGAKIARVGLPRDFAIDVQHELALYLRDEVNLTHSDALCLQHGPDCASWIVPFRPCGLPVDPSKVYFAVKTCSKFHGDRVPVVRRTWAVSIEHQVTFFSDVEDESIPTVSLGVANTDTGHCSKTMAIIDHIRKTSSAQWFVIADDDTILGVRKLRELLSCYDPSRPLLIGQKYGYASSYGYGYDYITGGGGMVLSQAAVQLLAGSPQCRCPQPDAPDDMWLGACSEALGVPIVHFPGFHQARPGDYPLAQLRTQHVISFHKHWMIDPHRVYADWFADQQPNESVEAPLVADPAGELLHETGPLFRHRQLPDEL